MRALAHEHPVHQAVLLLLLSMVAYGMVHALSAHARQRGPSASMPAAPAPAGAEGQLGLHAADADADIGPGEEEPILVR